MQEATQKLSCCPLKLLIGIICFKVVFPLLHLSASFWRSFGEQMFECLQQKTVRLHSGYTITWSTLSSGVFPILHIQTLILSSYILHPLYSKPYIVLHKTAPLNCASSSTPISSRLFPSPPSLLRQSGRFCPFHAHCSPYSAAQHGWSDAAAAAAAESERTSG